MVCTFMLFQAASALIFLPAIRVFLALGPLSCELQSNNYSEPTPGRWIRQLAISYRVAGITQALNAKKFGLTIAELNHCT